MTKHRVVEVIPWSEISVDDSIRIISANMSSSSLNLFLDKSLCDIGDEENGDDWLIDEVGDTDLKLLVLSTNSLDW